VVTLFYGFVALFKFNRPERDIAHLIP
jgi:hypothetical protein